MEEFIGIIKIFAGNFAPRGWAFCAGQAMPINQYQAVFAILGTTYGGNGQTTFNLPDLRSRVPVGAGQGPGLSDYVLGETAGNESTTLILPNMPAHNHVISGNVKIPVNDSNADADGPVGAYLGTPSESIYSGSTNGFAANADTSNLATGVVGSNIPFSNLQPYLGVNYIICLEGIFPSRN
ncbi:tail fiber protein [uncultured Flavobacterium sp.]|uniref:phage tail protein n=1 Tax=uncultured Flavobacterium sp. TaxID=165435 RepID=UPI0025E79D7A|nr:tail fiber protein [uncultured Flavobacterium sp.]